ncbi:hypothetical protein C8R45DRAFT_941045 [Mycena sanguinolenta]|nr:hypothetical protein C8R45DRAFT_941045 [Mycena sanguinolenta]
MQRTRAEENQEVIRRAPPRSTRHWGMQHQDDEDVKRCISLPEDVGFRRRERFTGNLSHEHTRRLAEHVESFTHRKERRRGHLGIEREPQHQLENRLKRAHHIAEETATAIYRDAECGRMGGSVASSTKRKYCGRAAKDAPVGTRYLSRIWRGLDGRRRCGGGRMHSASSRCARDHGRLLRVGDIGLRVERRGGYGRRFCATEGHQRDVRDVAVF